MSSAWGGVCRNRFTRQLPRAWGRGEAWTVKILTCPICKHAVSQDYSPTSLIGNTLYYYHDGCYDVYVERLQNLWQKLTGPQEEFDRWLKEDVLEGQLPSGMQKGYKFKRLECYRCGRFIAANWLVRHLKSGCVIPK